MLMCACNPRHTEIGTGIRTVAGQTAAEQLGVELAAVSVETGDTRLPAAPVSGGSNSTASVCSAVLKACEQIRRRIFQAVTASGAGVLAGHDAAALTLQGGAVVAPDGTSLPLREALQAVGAGVIEEYAEFVPPGVAPDAMQKLCRGSTTMLRGTKAEAFAFGAEFVELRIHARTREIRVPRLLWAFAAGRIMNTRTARSQLMGGLIWRMSAALLEATELDPRSARTVNRDLQDYLVPVNADVG